MSEEETISLLAEIMAPGRDAAVVAQYREPASRLWRYATAMGVEENLAEIALAYDLASQPGRGGVRWVC